MVNTPIPHSLKSEAKKAAKILREFTMPNAKTGPDKLIPAGIFAKAKGLAIITVFKAGFLVTARGGSGIVIAKVNDSLDYASGWSAPSAIGMAGLGGGFEIGMEVTDFVILLNSKAAVEAFSKGGNLTLGGNFTIAAGPLGRNVEGDIAVRGSAAIYTYSKTKGIFAGISVEGSALIERKDANRKFYGEPIRAHQILRGDVAIPDECQPLYQVMRDHQEVAAKVVLKMAKNRVKQEVSKSQSEWNLSSLKSFSAKPSPKSSPPKSSSPKSSQKPKAQSPTKDRKSSSKMTSKPAVKRSSFSSFSSFTRQRRDSEPSANTKDHGRTQMSVSTSASAVQDPWADIDAEHDSDSEGLWVVADFPFQGQLSCDLSFQAGDKMLVTWKSNSRDDWWEGITRTGQQGIFPANYFHILHS